MKLLEINSKIDDFKSEIENLRNQEEELKKDLKILLEENKEVNISYESISNTKQSQDSNSKEKEKSSNLILTIFTIILSTIVYFFLENITDGYGFLGSVITFILVPVTWGMIERNKKDKNSLEEKYTSIKKEKSKSDEKVSELKQKLYDVQSNIEVIHKKTISHNNIISFNKIYDLDDNGLLDIGESTNIEKIIKNKQKEIREIEKKENRDYLKDFSKIILFLNSFQSQLVSDFENIQNSGDDFDSINSKFKIFDEEYKLYKTLLSSMILMVSNLVNDNTLDYYKLRELFDKLSVFESNFEKNLIGELRGLNKVTSELIDITLQSRDEIISELSFLDSSISNIEFELKYLNKN